MAGGSDDVLRFGRLSKSTMTTLGCSAAMPHIFTRSSLGSLEKGWKAFGSARVGGLKDKILGWRSSGLVSAHLARGFSFFLNLLEGTQLGAGKTGILLYSMISIPPSLLCYSGHGPREYRRSDWRKAAALRQGLEVESLAMGYSLYVSDTIAKQWYEENAVC
jgi:hypothetical protein